MPSKLKKILKIKKWLLDMLFPIKCLSCKEEGSWICSACLIKIKPREKNVCPICEKNITPDGRTCFVCKKNNPLEGLLIASSYKDKIVSQAVHFYKYKFITDLHLPLGNLMIRVLQKSDIPLGNLIIPVPLHKKRLRWRGFNQAELLAENICKNLLLTKLEIAKNLLIRKKNTRAQMKLKKYQDRFENIKDAFEVTNKNLVFGKTILLVDDIATTGSTLFECAKALKNAGAAEIFAVVIARQEISEN